MTQYRIEVDLAVIEYALTCLTDICESESEYLKHATHIDPIELEKLSLHKEDVMHFLSMNVNNIKKYIELNKSNLDALDEIDFIKGIDDDLPFDTHYPDAVEVVFLNDSEDMPMRIKSQLSLMLKAIKKNLSIIAARKTVVDMTMKYMKKILDNQHKKSYSPRGGKKQVLPSVIHDQNY